MHAWISVKRLLTLTPVNPGLPFGPSFPLSPVSPFSPLSPSWPRSPFSPWSHNHDKSLFTSYLKYGFVYFILFVKWNNSALRAIFKKWLPLFHQGQLDHLLPLGLALPAHKDTHNPIKYISIEKASLQLISHNHTLCPISPCSPMFPAGPMAPCGTFLSKLLCSKWCIYVKL